MGNYVILDRLGTGGMGQVFKARHRKMDRIVAIKMLPPDTLRSADALKRFLREVKAVARLSHPNIVTAYDADEAKGVHFLVMEYVEGENLSALVKRNGPLPIEQAAVCMLQAARGLEYAHSEGIIHRDIKPSNLLLDRRGSIKILDMGLARIEESVEPDATPVEDLTQSGYVMGSVDYMSPEQGFDLRTTDHRSDIYSLGATLHYLLTGRPMYRSNTLVKRILAHRDHPLPSLRCRAPDVPEVIDATFQRMVAKRPEDRQQSMGEVIAALEAWLARGGKKAESLAVDANSSAQHEGSEEVASSSSMISLLDELLLEESIPSTGPIRTPFSFGMRRRTKRLLFGISIAAVALFDLDPRQPDAPGTALDPVRNARDTPPRAHPHTRVSPRRRNARHRSQPARCTRASVRRSGSYRSRAHDCAEAPSPCSSPRGNTASRYRRKASSPSPSR